MQKYHFNNKKIGLSLIVTSLAWLMSPLANAQSDAQLLESVRACQSVAGLSSRLNCYDRLLPPTVETAEIVEIEDLGRREAPLATREELTATIAELEMEKSLEVTAKIIEVAQPNLRTTRLTAEDGRVFVQSKATSVIKWPTAPFDIEIDKALFGTIYITIPGRRDRIRVSIED